MKSLFRFLIVATGLGIVIYYSAADPSKPLEGPDIGVTEVEDIEELEFNNESLQKPTVGISTFIGEPVDKVVKQFKKPHRIEYTPYNYDWWIYNQYEMYIMFGVQDGLVKQVYTNSTAFDVSPYRIYMSDDDIFRMTIIGEEISVELEDSIYIYTMSDYDLKHRILVRFEDLYAQLYVDANSKKLSGIRFMDGETLVVHQPYEMQFVGEFNEEQQLSFNDEVNYSNAQILYELTNVFRLKEKQPIFNYSYSLSKLAQSHSEDMLKGQYVSSDSPSFGSLKDRASHFEIQYETIENNIASGYYDAIEAVHSLLNSNKHRNLIFDEKFSEIGVGVAERYYTQVFVEPVEAE